MRTHQILRSDSVIGALINSIIFNTAWLWMPIAALIVVGVLVVDWLKPRPVTPPAAPVKVERLAPPPPGAVREILPPLPADVCASLRKSRAPLLRSLERGYTYPIRELAKIDAELQRCR